LLVLGFTAAAERFAAEIVQGGDIPATREDDGLHILIETVHWMDYLVTWNFGHINDADMKSRIQKTDVVYACPVIC